ncbi:MAG: biopolymer transporter ExbD [Bryobacteraceae bacterium]
MVTGNFRRGAAVYEAMAMNLGGQRGVRAEINITPMIDVLLVLIIMFMVIVPLKPVGLPSQAPQPAPESAPARPDPRHVVVFIKGGGDLELNRQPLKTTELKPKLLSIFQGRPDGVVFIDAAPALEFAEVAQVIDIARGAGVENVGLMPGRKAQ